MAAAAVATTINLTEVAAKWRMARRLYPLYSSLAVQHGLGEPCRELESPINRSEPESLRRIEDWFQRLDGKIQAWQLRQALQTTHLGNEDNLRELLRRCLRQTPRSAELRDKIDFLFVQYFAHRAPEDAHNTHINFGHVAAVLHHAIGTVAAQPPAVAVELETVLTDLNSCTSLGELLQKRIVERARAVKDRAGNDYYEMASLVAFTRFNFLMRMGFFRLMHADLHAIRFALHSMEARGQQSCDCSAAGLGQAEPLSQLRAICHDWKKPFRAAYSAGSNFKQLVAIRAAVEAELNRPLPAIEPVAEAATSAPELNVKAAPAPAAAAPLVLEECLERIAEQLLHVTPGVGPTSNVVIGTTKLLLASWEVAAYTHGGDEVADALQRAVAARAIVQVEVEKHGRGEAADIRGAIGSAHVEAAEIQEQIAAAKDAKDIDAAVNLAATAKRLLSAIADAEKAQ